ncbi:hypothetical protein E2C01_042594 [Portunus trituberculatus]|uniref:Uncharacterized protein n=1 Tax=Portunus trituberculatus TaxID=210409 RepID=A0A5B7FMT8_PORTR|nr:hypothetical protein [Portunus trituberculatus]
MVKRVSDSVDESPVSDGCFPYFPYGFGWCVSSPILEAFVTKVSEVEAEFHRRISEVREELRERISDLQAEFCRVSSESEGDTGPGGVASGVYWCEEEKGPQSASTNGNDKFLHCVGGSEGGERKGRR